MLANFVVNFLNTLLFTKLYYYKLLKIWGAKSIVGPPPPQRKFGGPVTLVSTGSGPHAPSIITLIQYIAQNHLNWIAEPKYFEKKLK